MKNRYKEFVYEGKRGMGFYAHAEEGMILELSEGEKGELRIKLVADDRSDVNSEKH